MTDSVTTVYTVVYTCLKLECTTAAGGFTGWDGILVLAIGALDLGGSHRCHVLDLRDSLRKKTFPFFFVFLLTRCGRHYTFA